MRGMVMAGSIGLFVLATMAGSWLVQVAGPGEGSDQWRLMSFRNAFGLGTRSCLFSFPVVGLCLIFRRQLWPNPLPPEIGIRNVLTLLLLGILLGRVNLATF